MSESARRRLLVQVARSPLARKLSAYLACCWLGWYLFSLGLQSIKLGWSFPRQVACMVVSCTAIGVSTIIATRISAKETRMADEAASELSGLFASKVKASPTHHDATTSAAGPRCYNRLAKGANTGGEHDQDQEEERQDHANGQGNFAHEGTELRHTAAAERKRAGSQQDDAHAVHIHSTPLQSGRRISFDSTLPDLSLNGSGASALEERNSLLAKAPKAAEDKAPMSRWWLICQRGILIPLPTVAAVLFAVYQILTPQSEDRALSLQISLILCAMVAIVYVSLAGIVWTLCSSRYSRVLAGVLFPLILVGLLRLWLLWTPAQTSYLDGIHTPILIYDPQLHVVTDSNFAQITDDPLNRYLAQRIEKMHLADLAQGLQDVPPFQMSLLDTPQELAIRRESRERWAIPPYWHIASIVPRRSLNFYAGSETCEWGAPTRFSELRPAESEPLPSSAVGGALAPNPSTAVPSSSAPSSNLTSLHLVVQCPVDQVRFEGSRNWFVGRRMHYSSSYMYRYDAEIFQPETAALSREVACVPTGQKDQCTIDTGGHQYFSVFCGSDHQRNYYVPFKEDRRVTDDRRRLMKEQLFTDAAAAPTAQPEAGADAEPVKAQPARRASRGKVPVAAPDALPVSPPILLLFIDAFSPQHMKRVFPKTVAVMRQAHRRSHRYREQREKVYRPQMEKQRTKERHEREQREAIKTNQQVDFQAQAAELAQADEEIFAAFDAAPDALPPSFDRRSRHSVYEMQVTNVLGGSTRINVATLLCAAFEGGGGAKLTPINVTLGDGSQMGGFTGQLPMPKPGASGYREARCAPENVLWNRLKMSGYVTAMVLNDCTDLLEIVTHEDGLRGRSHSADYEVVAPWCDGEYDNKGLWNNWYGPFALRRRCIAGRHVHEYVFDYGREFIRAHDSTDPTAPPWFLYLSFMEAHEASLAVIGTLDTAVSEFLSWVLFETANPPLVQFQSDHGNFMGPWAEMRAAQIEYHTPTIVTIVPEAMLYQRDVTRKKQIRRKLSDMQKQQQPQQAATPPPTPGVVESVPFFTQHFDPFSPWPYSPLDPTALRLSLSGSAQPAAPTPVRALMSHLLSTSVGLWLHGNQHTMVTHRETYWFLRGVPDRIAHVDVTASERLALLALEASQQAWMRRTWDQLKDDDQLRRAFIADPHSLIGSTFTAEEAVAFSPAMATLRQRLTLSLLTAADQPATRSGPTLAPADKVDWPVIDYRPMSLGDSVPMARTCHDAAAPDIYCVDDK